MTLIISLWESVKNMENLVGKKINKLVIIEEIITRWPSGKFNHMLRCKCDCGKEIISNKYRIKNGKTKSCGCHRIYVYKNLVGKRFGMLVVLKQLKAKKINKKYKYISICKCDCGNIKEIDNRNLTHNFTTSCGCRRDQYDKIRGEKSIQFTGYKQISGRDWGKYKRRAKNRKLKFEISIEYAWNLYEQQMGLCALTGIPIVFGNHNTNATASIDRIDNEKGYIEGNIQWVHKNVNIMRNVYSVEHFIEICLLVARKNNWKPSNMVTDFIDVPELSMASKNEKRFHNKK